MVACRSTKSWCTTRPTARWRSCWSGSSRRSFPWRSACSTALPPLPTRRTSTRRRGPPGSDARPPTSGRCSPAMGRGRSSRSHRLPVSPWPPPPRGASGAGVVNGKLVVVGGWGVGRRLVGATTIYDPATDRWRDAAPIPTPRDHLTAAVAGGLVYAIGGRPLSPDRNYDVAEAYDPAADRWTKRSAMPSRRGGLAAAVLDGVIHVIGGETRGSVFANHEVYDPATDRWITAPALPVARHGLAAAAVGGKLYVIGGGPRAGFSQTGAVDVFAP